MAEMGSRLSTQTPRRRGRNASEWCCEPYDHADRRVLRYEQQQYRAASQPRRDDGMTVGVIEVPLLYQRSQLEDTTGCVRK